MPLATYDGLDALALARRLGVPRAAVFARTTSTMDEAHALAAAGAPAGTLVVAEHQTAGRGRTGGRWFANPGRAVLCTLIERPESPASLTVLSLRVGLGVAQALDSLAGETVRVKWPNDLMLAAGKVAGVLIEARWKGDHPEWVSVAIGVNVGAPPERVANAAALPDGLPRLAVLEAVFPHMRRATTLSGPLTASELKDWEARDWLVGRRTAAPVAGQVRGILATGEIVIDTPSGPAAYRGRHLVLEDA